VAPSPVMPGVARRVAVAYRVAYADLPRDVWLLASAALVNRSGTMVLPFLALYLTRELHFSTVTAGQILSLYGLGSMAGSLLGGWLTDRVGAIRVQIASLLAAGVGFLALSQLRTASTIGIAVLLTAAVGDAFRPALFAAIAVKTPAALLSRAFALVRMASNLGMAVGPALGGFLATRRYLWLFVGDAGTCWAAAVVLAAALLARERAVRLQETARTGPRPSPWHDGPFLLFLGLMALLGTVFFQLFTTFPLYLRSAYGLHEGTIGFLLALNAIAIVTVEMLLLKLVERYAPLRVAAVGTLLVCGGFAVLPLGRGLAFAILSTAVWTLGEMLAMPLSSAHVGRHAPAASRGSYMGAYTLAFSLAAVVAPTLGTLVYARFGPAVLWMGVGAAGLVLFGGFNGLAARLRRPGAEGLPSAADRGEA
jgi:predicted MFS family arabinose efflux permease